MRVLISGSHGFIGEALVARLEALDHSVTRLVRDKAEEGEIPWDPMTGDVDVAELEGFDAVVHLGGVSIGEKRWTEAERGRIWDSRITSTDFLAQRLAQTIDRPKVFVVGSAVGIYGERGEEELSESSLRGEGFLADVVENWESAAEPASAVGIRVVNVRTGIVIGPKGGLIERLLPVFGLAMGGKLGDGTQWMSWVSLRDEVEAIIFAIEKRSLSGPINVTNPEPVRNAAFTKAFGRAIRRPTVVPIWPWMLNLAFGAPLTREVLLVSQRAYPRKLIKAGFRFQDNDLDEVLKNVRNASVATYAPSEPKAKTRKSKFVPKIFRFDDPKDKPRG